MASIEIWSDIGCPWAHVAVFRLHQWRSRLGLEGQVHLDHRAFPLEVMNERPTPRRILEAEIPVAGALEPEAGWQMWQGDPSTWPVTTLPALEAVQAAKQAVGIEASERLDRALRAALFGESRCVSMRHVIAEVATSALGKETATTVMDALDRGVARPALVEQWEEAKGDRIKGSPHLFLPDGADFPNPGIEMHWHRNEGVGFPVIDIDDPDVYKSILESARAT